MSYKVSEITCDWCGKEIDSKRHSQDHGGDVACNKCYSELEEHVSGLEKEIEELRAKIPAPRRTDAELDALAETIRRT